MSREIYDDDEMPRSRAAAAAPDQVSRANSSVSKPVKASNMEQLQDFRSQLGLIVKNRPQKDEMSNAFDGVSVQTPGNDMELDRLSAKLSTVGIRDVGALQGSDGPGGMNKFIKNLATTNRPQYEKLIELMKFYNAVDVDLRFVSQLKASFISKERGAMSQIPLAALKDSMKSVFKHYRQVDEIVAKTAACVEVELAKDGMVQKMADANKLAVLTEFMRCFPMLVVKRDKNNSQGMNFVMQDQQNDQGVKSGSQASAMFAAKVAGTAELDYVK
jgi:hypothetical protein